MIKNCEIINYKCFENFKLDNLSQINIISGDNNVGKSALLEAIYIVHNCLGGRVTLLFEIFDEINKQRGVENNKLKSLLQKMDFSISYKTFNLPSKYHNLNFTVKYKTKFNLTENEKQKVKEEYSRDYYDYLVFYIEKTTLYFIAPIEISEQFYQNWRAYPYINSSIVKNKQLIELYSEIQTLGIQHKILETLQIFDENITWLEPQLIDDELFLRVSLKNPKISMMSFELGEGTNRMIEILTTMLTINKHIPDKAIFIDEIENGIHYSKLKDIWKAIIQIVQKENIQLFVTTHDKETIEALNEASEELDYKDITSIKLFKNENKQISSTIREYKNFSYGINRGADMR